MQPTIITIGVYGFDAEHFFQALQDAHIDTLCDLRNRRGVRGSEYTFANSARLQKRLAELNIRYLHLKQLAPSQETRGLQYEMDKQAKVGKRQRAQLGEAFREAYQRDYLSHLDAGAILQEMGEDTHVVGLLCVERDPEACHRALVAEWLRQNLGVTVKHITP